jgi:hypothetical protein
MAFGTSTNQSGVFGTSTNGIGVQGQSTATNGIGVQGSNTQGVGVSGSGGVYGVKGTGDTGVTGTGTSKGVFGAVGSFGYGVYGLAPSGWGVAGIIKNDGSHTSFSDVGVYGESPGGPGVVGSSDSWYGVEGVSISDRGVHGRSNSGIGVYGATESGYAGWFAGKVYVTGALTKAGGGFKIDHPLDPANRYLAHSFVESPEMKNIYDGVVTLDDKGRAKVELPVWFEALNENFRYQLTPLGASAPNLYISRELADNRFTIGGGEPQMRVSWQVTGVRRDAWARAYPLPVEEDKPSDERGYYLHPEIHDQPAERGLMYTKPKPRPSSMDLLHDDHARTDHGLEITSR